VVAESNGGRGLDSEEYTLVSVNDNDVFTVRRHNHSVHHVYILDWDL
jgi:hypothetical protein